MDQPDICQICGMLDTINGVLCHECARCLGGMIQGDFAPWNAVFISKRSL